MRTFILAATLAAGAGAPGCARGAAEHAAAQVPGAPRLYDTRLQLTVFASEPEIVTPIGIAVDRQDRVFVLESHTHLQGSDYPGPTSDRVKIFTDRDGDGRAERVSVFAEDIDDGMNLAFSPAGELYVVAAKGVWALHDRDGDGVSEARTAVLRMARPSRVYDHAALLGIAFSHDGWLYVSRGNTGSAAWRVEGTDGTFVGGYGDGGNIIRARPDGSDVSEFATGFWNAFDLTFDAAGRLLAADNDPDSRGPNRLVHVVEGGDYGYKSLYGGSGIHPYLSWNGELPGTLPYAAALGEAPSGLLVGADAALPRDYRHDVLVSIWEERRIVRVRLEPSGTSVAGHASVLAEGDAEFRPVAFAADSRGVVYITDWVLRAYPNHGRGRIWRLSAREGIIERRAPFVPPDPDPAGAALRALYAAGPADVERLRDALTSPDPFLRHAAVIGLARPSLSRHVKVAAEHADARVRLGALLALMRSRGADGESIAARLLADPDVTVRRMALVWAGSSGMVGLRPRLDTAILSGPPSPELFETYLATLEQLAPGFVSAYATEAEPYARLLKRMLRPRFVETFLTDRSRPASLRGMAITHLTEPVRHVQLLVRLAGRREPAVLRREAVRSLGLIAAPASAAALLRIVQNTAEAAPLRADALLGLGRQDVNAAETVLTLLDDQAPEVRLEAARYLRSTTLGPAALDVVAQRLARVAGGDNGAIRDQLSRAMGSGPSSDIPSPDADAWLEAIGAGGDSETGRRVFFSRLSACADCHVAERRGGTLGPDLTNIGRSKSRRQILDAILQPSAEISPEFQGWFVRTRDGKVHTGRQIDVGAGGKADLYVLSGEFMTLEGVEEYGPMPRSLMPDGLETNLTMHDMRDLIAYLSADR